MAGSLFIAQGAFSMSSPPPELLVWQGAADRKPTRFLALRVDAVRKESGGLFGIGRSPSLAGSMPDARVVDGQAVSAEGKAVSIQLRAPGGELPAGLAQGGRLALGLVDATHVICMWVPPDSVTDADLPAWAAQLSCR
jgi:hypothetical protein